MNVFHTKNCPNCGRAKKDHTRWQKEACGRAMAANPTNEKSPQTVTRGDWRENK